MVRWVPISCLAFLGISVIVSAEIAINQAVRGGPNPDIVFGTLREIATLCLFFGLSYIIVERPPESSILVVTAIMLVGTTALESMFSVLHHSLRHDYIVPLSALSLTLGLMREMYVMIVVIVLWLPLRVLRPKFLTDNIGGAWNILVRLRLHKVLAIANLAVFLACIWGCI